MSEGKLKILEQVHPKKHSAVSIQPMDFVHAWLIADG